MKDSNAVWVQAMESRVSRTRSGTADCACVPRYVPTRRRHPRRGRFLGFRHRCARLTHILSYRTDIGTPTHLGAGFYLDATHATWSTHYNMYTYIKDELPSLLKSLQVPDSLPLDFTRQSIFGHSMGGEGAITLYLRTIASGTYKSASAFAPALNPTNGQWGVKAFNGYLQNGVKEGERWDPTCLIWELPEGTQLNMLIDVVSIVCVRSGASELDARLGKGGPVL
jgi:hypothetical protein